MRSPGWQLFRAKTTRGVRRFFTMAPKSSPKASKIVLWRNTIQLFHETSRPPFVGPFRKLDFKYRVGPILLNTDGQDRTPDIAASGPSGWVALELGTGGASKSEALSK